MSAVQAAAVAGTNAASVYDERRNMKPDSRSWIRRLDDCSL